MLMVHTDFALCADGTQI